MDLVHNIKEDNGCRSTENLKEDRIQSVNRILGRGSFCDVHWHLIVLAIILMLFGLDRRSSSSLVAAKSLDLSDSRSLHHLSTSPDIYQRHQQAFLPTDRRRLQRDSFHENSDNDNNNNYNDKSSNDARNENHSLSDNSNLMMTQCHNIRRYFETIDIQFSDQWQHPPGEFYLFSFIILIHYFK